jgi:hypothetical protein
VLPIRSGTNTKEILSSILATKYGSALPTTSIRGSPEAPINCQTLPNEPFPAYRTELESAIHLNAEIDIRDRETELSDLLRQRRLLLVRGVFRVVNGIADLFEDMRYAERITTSAGHLGVVLEKGVVVDQIQLGVRFESDQSWTQSRAIS